MSCIWHQDWFSAKQRFVDWWNHKGVVLQIVAPADQPWEPVVEPEPPASLEAMYLDAKYRARRNHYDMSRAWHGAQTTPVSNADLGPGSLGTMLGSEPAFAPDTVWYHPCIDDPDTYGPIQFDPNQKWFLKHLEIAQAQVEMAQGRYLVGMPDLIENIDTLGQMRDNQTLMMEMIERPEWVEKRVWEINDAFFAAFDRLHQVIQDGDGGNAFMAFRLWGPGKTAKVQCDASAMFSLAMFRQFVTPALTAQCQWLDYSMYHLDGTQCIQHLDSLLEIDPLHAIEWTPQAGIEGGGNPRWFEMYRRILAAGKSLQIVDARPEEVAPLLDAIGTDGVMVITYCDTADEADALARQIG